MIIECSSCHSKYKYDESKLTGGVTKKVKCPKCKGIIEVHSPDSAAPAPVNPEATERTFSGMDETGGAPPRTARVRRDTLTNTSVGMMAVDANLKMPEDRKFSLAVISGQNSGEIFQISKPCVLIGRSDSDIVIQDMEASRQHARLDIMGDRILLRDLESTNGTYVNEQRIATVTLDNHSEFRIGTTILMLIITDLD